MTISLRDFVLPVMFRVLAVICGVTFAAHASAEGLRDFLKTIGSLDQTIQEKVQGVLGSTNPDRQEGLEQPPGTRVTTTPVTSDKIRIKAQPGVAKESTDTEEEEDKPNLISSKKVQLKSDAILKEGPSGEAGTTEAGQSVMSGSSVGGGDNRQSETSSQALNDPSAAEGAPKRDESDVHWKGEITMIHRQTEGSSSVGEIVGTFRLRVDWKETHRIEVKNEEGKLTGVLVILADHDSRWSGDVGGVIQHNCASRTTKEGAGRGTKTVDHGWVYFSLSDDDPVLDVMPHGTYHIDGPRDERPSGPVTREYNLCGPNYSISTQIQDLWGLLLLDMGRELWRPLPCSTPETCRSATFQPSALPASAPWIPAEALKAKLDKDFFPPDVVIGGRIDPEPRVVTEDKMRGHYLANAFGTESSGFLSVELTWDLERVVETSPVLEKTVRNWRPEYENEANNIPITAHIEQPAIPGKFRFTLFQVTREKGWAMNAGDRNDDSLDLEFVDGLVGFLTPKETSDGWEIEANSAMTTATVKIKANDYGAWGKLKCEVNVDGHWWPCKSKDGKEFITIPFDEDENKIADFWEEQNGVSGDATADDDETPEGREPGDGYSNYEEYRGFQIEGEWTDTDPKEKDLFVHNDADHKTLVIDAGIDLFEKASELTVHKIEADEYDDERIVNFNRGEHQAITRDSKGQKGLHIVVTDELLGDAICGRAKGPGDYLGGPNVIEEIQIKNSCIEKERYTLPSTFISFDDGSFIYTDQEWLEQWEAPADVVPMKGAELVAHELGHGVNLYHPGFNWEAYACGNWAAGQGGVFSGSDDNLMRYTAPSRQYVDGKCYDLPLLLDNAPQTAFAKELKGTGINAGPLRKIQEEDGGEYWLPMAGDATCTGTLITNMSLNQDKTTVPPGC